MLCDECKKRPTKVHVTRIINGEKTKISLCEECAEKYKIKQPFGTDGSNDAIQKFLSGLLDEEVDKTMSPRVKPDTTCSGCGLTYGDFSAHGRLGCGQCYTTFERKIDPLLIKIHRKNVHAGKVPHSEPSEDLTEEVQADQELERLRRELQLLVDEERFEEAATTRDRIREIEAENESTS